jgi:hypothetical protein
MKPLSEQFADLSVRAKKAEDSVAAARKDSHDRVVAAAEKARANVTAAIDKLDQDLKAAGASATDNWKQFQAKVAATQNSLKAAIDQKKREHRVERAARYADSLETEAAWAIDYASAAVDDARAAVLDAIAARMDAQAKRVA